MNCYYLELGMKNDEDEEEKSHLIEVNPVIEFEKLDKGNYFQPRLYLVDLLFGTIYSDQFENKIKKFY